MSEWRERSLGDLLDIKHGFAFKGAAFSQGGVCRLVTPGNFYEQGGFRDRGPSQKSYTGPIPDEYVLAPGSVVIAMTEQAPGLLGSSGLVPRDDNTWLHNQRIGLVRARDGAADLRFLYYLFNDPSVRAQISASATGTKVRHTAPGRIQAVKASIPDISTQSRIASILSAFDKIIEINERRVELLEDLARSLYREWFVRFRFPGHEEVEVVDSELGPIPETWEVRRLREVVSADKGLSYKGAHLTEPGDPMANLKCLTPAGGFRRGGTKTYSGSYKERHTIAPGDLIVANTDLTQAGHVIGSPAIVPGRGFERGGLISHHLFAVRPQTGRDAVPFLFQLFSSERFRSFARERASGTTVLGFRPNDFLDFAFVAPPRWLCGRFTEVATAAIQSAEALTDANEDLAATRDLLLPRLVTGRVDISDVDLGHLLPAETT